MNNGSHLHTSSQRTSKQSHSNVQKLAAVGGVLAVLNAGMPVPVSSASTHKIMDDTAGKAMNFVPPSPKTEVNMPSSRNILVKYTIQPGDTISTLACIFGVKKGELLRYNPQITDENIIKAGKQLVIPNPSRNIAKCVIDVRGETKSMVDSKEKRTPIVGAQEPLSPEDFKKAFLADSANVKMLAKYAKLHNMEVFQKIKNAHISKAEKQRKLFDLYANEHADFAARAYVQEIQGSNPDKQVVENVETLLKDAGYTLTATDFLKAKMWTESSGGRSIGAIIEAQKLMKLYGDATLPKVKEKYETKIADTIKTAISWIVGPSNDVGPYGMRPGWVRAEQLNGWAPGVELTLVDNVHTLRQGVKKIFINAVKENLSQKEIMDQLIELDSRFDGQLMGEAALFSFQRITSNLTEKQGLTPEQAVRGANIDYNKGEGTTKRILQEKGHVTPTSYSDKMDAKLKLMSAFNKPQTQVQAEIPTGITKKNVISVKHGIDHTKVRSAPAKKSKTGTTLCSRTAHDNLRELGVEPDQILRGDARHIIRTLRKDDKALLFRTPEQLKQFFLAQAAQGSVIWDVYANSRKGHRLVAFIGKDGKPYILDPYYSDGVTKKKTSPKLFDDYMCHNFARHFSKMIVNTDVGTNNDIIKVATKAEKQPTPMKVIMASAPAEKASVPYVVHSNGTINLSQNVSASVVKLTDTTVGDNHLRTGIDMGDNKILFPAVISNFTKKRVNLVRMRIDILLSNVTDPVERKRIEKKLGENPAWTMAKNIKLQKNRYMKGGNVQALKNAKGLYELLMMCEREIAKIPTFNKMAA